MHTPSFSGLFLDSGPGAPAKIAWKPLLLGGKGLSLLDMMLDGLLKRVRGVDEHDGTTPAPH